MISFKSIKDYNIDKYEINARIRPALFVLLPAVIFVIIEFPQSWTARSAFMSLFVSCGALILLTNLSRSMGRRLEIKWKDCIGRRHTAYLLFRNDKFISKMTKKRYYEFFRQNGIGVPSEAEEVRDPALALDKYRSAVDWLLIQVKKSQPKFLLEDNISYGFRRNLVGMKPVALVILALCLIASALACYLHIRNLESCSADLVLMIVYMSLIAIWSFLINKAFVVDASLAFAQRLLQICDSSTV